MHILKAFFMSAALVLSFMAFSGAAYADPEPRPGFCHNHVPFGASSWNLPVVTHCNNSRVIRGPVDGSPHRYRHRRAQRHHVPPYIVIQRCHWVRTPTFSFRVCE